MSRTQRFSSVFHRYAKHHGLRKEDLEYYFVNPLENEDTPESVLLKRGDTIMVRKRRKPDPPEQARMALQMIAITSSESISSSHIDNNTSSGNVICVKKEDFATHEEEDHHHTTTTMMEEDGIQVRAHKCILLKGQSGHFKALLRQKLANNDRRQGGGGGIDNFSPDVRQLLANIGRGKGGDGGGIDNFSPDVRQLLANNGRGKGGGSGNQSMYEHVEFTVKAEEDLYSTGSENTIRRVRAGDNFIFVMSRTQRFSSVFHRYAKHHGLRKEDLEYYFVNPLENEDTPESVQLQRGDIIMVRKRRKPQCRL